MDIFKRVPNLLITERIYEPRVLIGHEFTRQPMEAKYRVDKGPGTSRCVDGFGYSCRMHHLANSVNEHKNTSFLVGICGESKDEVNRDS